MKAKLAERSHLGVRPKSVPIKACGCPDYQAMERVITRRSFLKRVGAGALVAGFATEGFSMRFAFGATPYAGDVVVVLSLRGGFDGLNVFVPTGDPNYASWRPNIGIPQSTLLQLDTMFGLHPAAAPLKPLYDAGKLAVIQAVGMAEPNRSHFQAMEEMERAAPGSSLRTGWIDRVIGLRAPGTAFQAVQMGNGMAPYAFVGPSQELAMWSVDGFGLDAAWNDAERLRWDRALRGLFAGAPAGLAKPMELVLGALETAQRLKDAGYTPAPGVRYPDTDLGRALKDVARLIKADVGLQIAAVDYGDWDMHAGMGTVEEGWLRDHVDELAGSLAAFAADLGPHLSGVTLVTLTEFGRRVEENGSGGTDHGYGQTVVLLGGGVIGGRVYGRWPGLRAADLIDGDLAATTDYRTVLAEILEKRCGAGSTSAVFPGLPASRPGALRRRS